MLSDSLVEAFRTRLEALGFDLADLRIGGTPSRPHVQVRIDWLPQDPLLAGGVTVDDCARASRALEAWLDGGEDGATRGPGPLGARYLLEVSSPGLDRPLKWPRHWARFVGRDVSARLPGLGRVRARLLAMPDAATVRLQPEGQEPREVPLRDIREARLWVEL
jgi:ribosome maturation factor RimP